MKNILLILVLLMVNISLSKDCDGTMNEIPIYEGEPILIKSIQNGKLYRTGNASMNSSIDLLHLYGTPHEMGIAYGHFLGEKLKDFIENTFIQSFDELLNEYLKKLKLSRWVIDFIDKYGVYALFDYTWMLQKEYVDPFILDLMKGISEGSSGVSLRRLVQYNIMPSTIHAGCTIIGAWGDALSPSENDGNSLIHVRALDFTLPLEQYPTIITYHFSNDDSEVNQQEESSNEVTIISGVGYVGFLSGFSFNANSDQFITYSEKVWGPFKELYQQTKGAPWNFHVMKAMRYGKNIHEIHEILMNEKRTSNLYLGIASSDMEEKCMIGKYSPEDVNLTTSTNQTRYDQHPYLSDMIYLDKHEQPTSHFCTSSLLQKYHGKISSEVMIRNILPVIQTGDLHSVVYDHGNQAIYVAFGNLKHRLLQFSQEAYNSQYVKIGFNFFRENHSSSKN